MSRLQTYRRVILPSAFRRALPAYSNEVIFMLHGSALASVITIIDLTGAGRIVASRYYNPFEAFIAVGVLYFCITFALRSEEHTSELQSLMRISYAVFCLKKKKT